ncbi:Hint domain-containing protein [Rhodovulum kholense]|uniref:Hint domain-containing protein n=1 Tax=Rhodovulum kholense TaxID=453584 RepID=UPI001304D55D
MLVRDGRALPVLWTGRREVAHAEMEADPSLCPVEIKAGALGNRQPVRLSWQHCVLIDADGVEALARAKQPARQGWPGVRIVRCKKGCSYHHILREAHALVGQRGFGLKPSGRGGSASRRWTRTRGKACCVPAPTCPAVCRGWCRSRPPIRPG